MKKKYYFIILLALLFLVVGGIYLAWPKIQENKIKAEIEKANYCSIDSDCVDIGGKCPFGCYIYVNRNEAERISQLVESFESKCVYGCVSCSQLTCAEGRCRAFCL